jgi:type II secretion system protein J
MSSAARKHRSSAACRGFTLIELLVALFITAVIFAMGYGAINQALRDRDALKDRQDRLTALQTTMRVMVQDFTQLAARPVRDPVGDSSQADLIGQAMGQSLTAGPTALTGGLLGGSSSSSLMSSTPGLGSSSNSNPFGSTSLSNTSSSGSSSSSSGSGSNGNSNDNGIDLVAFTRTGWANPAGIQRPALERVSYRLENGTVRRLHWPVLDATEATAPIKRDLLDHVKSITFRFLTDARQWTDQWPPLGNAGTAGLRMRPLAIEVTIELEDWGRIRRVIEVPA